MGREKKEIVGVCCFLDCGRPLSTMGYCVGHYMQLKRGRKLTELFLKSRPVGSEPRIEYDEVPCQVPGLIGPCHVFLGMKSLCGYGRVSKNRKMIPVHRYIWERDRGPIPPGMVMDHMCRNRACCNVNHLRVVTRKINVTENIIGCCWQIHAAKTHCPKGHPYDQENTIRNKNGRACKQCRKERRRVKKL